ncbi:TrkA C-terminal domain-containing protein [Haloarchaeobius sp. DFWS5]|uniref:Lrp/AsnC family transcriptional regulator n=1 Tax=Haloarchaeobius sp. DFWS5 TaxID=3446114 RepID=UPI003EBBF708
MSKRLDEVDRRIVYRLMGDARNTSAPDIAAEVDVSPGTIRNRIEQLEHHGVITGYHAAVDFEAADGRLTNLFICTAPVPEQEKLSAEVRQIPGVVNVRELLSGQRNLHVVAIATDMDDVTRIGRALASLGLEIEDESLMHREHAQPYSPFGPEDHQLHSLTDFINLAGEAEVVELAVVEDSAVAGLTLSEANDSGLIDPETLVIAVERDGRILTPKGDTTIEPNDLVTVFSQAGVSDDLTRQFTAKAEEH